MSSVTRSAAALTASLALPIRPYSRVFQHVDVIRPVAERHRVLLTDTEISDRVLHSGGFFHAPLGNLARAADAARNRQAALQHQKFLPSACCTLPTRDILK